MYKRIIWASVLLGALAIVVPYWPLSVVAILLAALGGEWPLAVVLGMLFDVLYGRPPGGFLHTLVFPFTILAVVLSVMRPLIKRYLRRDSQKYL